jgi:hypothetical protein
MTTSAVSRIEDLEAHPEESYTKVSTERKGIAKYPSSKPC